MLAVSAAGEELCLKAGSILELSLRSAQLDTAQIFHQLGLGDRHHATELARLEVEHHEQLAAQAELCLHQLRLRALDLEAIEARIAAMRASRFWKLRDRWFALKRALRLTDEL